MEALLLLLAFPLVWPFIAKRIWGVQINVTEMSIQLASIPILIVIIWQSGYPKINLDGYKIISSGHAKEAFKTGIDTGIKLR